MLKLFIAARHCLPSMVKPVNRRNREVKKFNGQKFSFRLFFTSHCLSFCAQSYLCRPLLLAIFELNLLPICRDSNPRTLGRKSAAATRPHKLALNFFPIWSFLVVWLISWLMFEWVWGKNQFVCRATFLCMYLSTMQLSNYKLSFTQMLQFTQACNSLCV